MKKVILLLAVISLFSCKDFKKGAAGESPDQTSETEVKLYVLDGGTVKANKLDLFSEDTTYQGQSKELADAYYVITHPKGNLMWDAGLPENLVGMAEPYTDPNGAFTVSRSDSLVNQLKQIGLSINDINYLALSHSHFDHIGHAASLKNAIWLVQESEHDFFLGDSAKLQQPDIYNIISHLTKPQKLNGDHDVFGDGKVIIKSMPGHTIGHQVLYLDLGLERPLLLTGDLYHFEENRQARIAPVFNYDIPMTKKSMEAFEVFAKEMNADVFIQHSMDDFKRLKTLLNNE